MTELMRKARRDPQEYLDLQLKNQMAESIARFVLEHPELQDVEQAYNVWSETVARPYCYPNTHEIMLFCLDMFDSCLHFFEPDFIQACLAIERRSYQKEYRKQCHLV